MTSKGKSSGHFSFDLMAFRKVSFDEIGIAEIAEGAIKPTDEYEVQTTVTMSLAFTDDRSSAQVVLMVTVDPDPKARPYKIYVELEGIFSGHDITDDSFVRFCKTAAPSVLFPYVREMVSKVTTDARYGSIRIKPMNLTGLADPGNELPKADPDVETSD